MNDTTTGASPAQGLRRKIGKYVLVATGLAVVAGMAAQLAWTYSGSAKWELEIDKGGVAVYSLKYPGLNAKRYRVVTRVKTTMNRAVAAMMDTTHQNCKDWVGKCTTSELIDPWDPQSLHYVQMYRAAGKFPFAPREFVLKTQFSRDPVTHAVIAEFIATPDRLPADACCFRIPRMHNVFRFTPVGDGEVQMEWSENSEHGMPYFLRNDRGPNLHRFFSSRAPKLLNKDSYKDATWSFLDAAPEAVTMARTPNNGD
jgi:hypothetical protein